MSVPVTMQSGWGIILGCHRPIPPPPTPIYSVQHLPGTTETAQDAGTQMTRPPSWRASVPPLLSVQLKHHSRAPRSLSSRLQDQYSLFLSPSQSCPGGTYTCALTCPHFTCEVLKGASGPADNQERMGRAGKWEGREQPVAQSLDPLSRSEAGAQV